MSSARKYWVPTINPLMADITHMLKTMLARGASYSHVNKYSRNSNTPLPRLATIQLNPSVVNRMIPNSEAIHSCPQAPS